MSRCFPYPPPGYSGNYASHEALIELIKLRRETEMAKAERKKERRKEKKAKNKEKKEKKRQIASDVDHDEKAYEKENSLADCKGASNGKRSRDEAEQLEYSDLTQEHELPVCSQSPVYSSDSIGNNKRRQAFSPNGCRSNGTLFRTQYFLQKHQECAVSVGDELFGPASGSTNVPTQQKSEIAPKGCQYDFCSTILQSNTDAQNELSCSTSGSPEICSHDATPSVCGSASFDKETSMVKFLYEDLIETGFLPILQSENPDFGNEEWLFGTKHQARRSEKGFKGNNGISCGTWTTCTSAQYLPDANIYALPLVVPY